MQFETQRQLQHYVTDVRNIFVGLCFLSMSEQKWINKILLKSRIKFYGKNEYSEYLNELLNERI